MNKKKTNKLTIYLIKKEYSDYKQILKNDEQLNEIDIEGVGKLYIQESNSYEPSWITNFFGGTLSGTLNLFNANSKAVLLVRINAGKEKKIFAITFGFGWHLLSPGVSEERFGLKVTLNSVDPNSLRSIDKKNMMNVPKFSREQLSRGGIAADFGIDIEQDLIQAITGKSSDEKFGNTITGKDSLNISTKVDIRNLKDFLNICYDKYMSDNYRENFGWIDQITEIKNPKMIEELNGKLLLNINSNNLDKTWMAIPDIINWADVAGFKYRKNRKDDLYDDLDISDFLNSLGDDQDRVDLNLLKRKKAYCFSSSMDAVTNQWTIYSCIYCEITDDIAKKTHLLSNGKWYEVEDDFAKKINSDFQNFPKSTVELPDFSKLLHKNEGAYNTAVSDENSNFACMDKKMINHGGHHGGIEFCDLFSLDNQFIHVKHYGGSSVLSHLFNQGLVSGELFLSDLDFRKKVDGKLPYTHKLTNYNAKPKPDEYEVVYAIISSSNKPFEIPFFSKVSLRNAKRRLETYGFKVSLKQISAINE